MVGPWTLFTTFVPLVAYSSRACCIRVATSTTVSARIGLNICRVPAPLANPLLSFWKNNPAIALTIISAKNRFLEGYCFISSSPEVIILSHLLPVATCKVVIIKQLCYKWSYVRVCRELVMGGDDVSDLPKHLGSVFGECIIHL
jgi:hypothetical protein